MATTSPPTTVAPTTTLTTVGPTTTLTTVAPTTAPPEVVITCDPITVRVLVVSVLSLFPGAARDATKDQTLTVNPIEVELTIGGSVLNQVFTDCVISIEAKISGTFVTGYAFSSIIELTTTLSAHGFYTSVSKSGWVKWSKIGQLDFTIDESNVAGERPLSFSGYVHNILRLGNFTVAYGENGINVLKPQGVNYSLEPVKSLGLLCRTAVVGDRYQHFFIDKRSRLFKFSTDRIEKLDYSEFLETLTSPSMILDSENDMLYICDGTNGFVYNYADKSFGKGPGEVSGLGYKDNTLYLVASDTISMPKFEICTDIYDFGTRQAKTIRGIEVGTDISDKIQAKIASRTLNNRDFKETSWVSVNPNGIAYIPCYGNEFKVYLRSFIVEVFDIDYIKIFGFVHGVNQYGG